MSVSAWCLRNDRAVAITTSRQLARSWKSSLGCSHFQSVRPDIPQGHIRLSLGFSDAVPPASAVFPLRTEFSQMITGGS